LRARAGRENQLLKKSGQGAVTRTRNPQSIE
jgi:hypothetical protein